MMPSSKENDHNLFRNIAKIDLSFATPVNTDTMKASGTGFFVNMLGEMWFVTNRHCFDTQMKSERSGSRVLVTVNISFPGPPENQSFSSFSVDLEKPIFRFCETADLAAISSRDFLFVNGGYATANFYPEILGNEGLFENIHAGENVFFIGYPNRLWDQVNHLPILRTASISSIPSYNYSIPGQRDEGRILVNGMSLGGNSGSPVFYDSGAGLRLIGIMSGHYVERGNKWDIDFNFDSDDGRIDGSIHSGLSYMIKSDLLHNIASWPKYTRHGKAE